VPDDPITLARDVAARLITSLHEGVFRATRGALFGEILGMPAVMVTVTGARSGKPRTVVLTTPVSDDTRVLLVASNGGSDRHPSWFHNLRANPEVSVMREGRTEAMRAHVVPDAERPELWAEVVRRYPGYAAYQQKTARPIPLVWLYV